MQELLLVLIWLQKKKEYFYTGKVSVVTIVHLKLLFTYLLNFYTFFLMLCLLFDCPLGPRLVAPVWSRWRGCQGCSSASGILHWEEYGADGFFFLTPLSFLLSLPPHLICHFDSNILLNLALFSLPAAPHYIEIYYLCCLLCMLDTVSLFSSLPLKPVFSSSRSALLYLTFVELSIAVWSPVPACAPWAVTPCLRSSTPPPVSPPLKASVLCSASLR